jgi:hypothetical protein
MEQRSAWDAQFSERNSEAPGTRRQTGGPADRQTRIESSGASGENMEDSWTRPEPEVEESYEDFVTLPCVGTRCHLAPDEPVLLLSRQFITMRAGPALIATTRLLVKHSRLALVYFKEAGVETGAILRGVSLERHSLPPLICQSCACVDDGFVFDAAESYRGAIELAEQLTDGAEWEQGLAQLEAEDDDRPYDLMVAHVTAD